jgi:hypothetical protein
VATRRREARLGESRGSSGGTSGVGFRRFAASIPDVPWRWRHRRGAARLLLLRTAWLSSHIDQRANGLSRPEAHSVIVVCKRHLPWSLVSSTVRGCFEATSRRCGGRIGGTRSSVATSRTEPGPKPVESGTRSRYDGGGSTTSPKPSVLTGRPERELVHPTDRVLGGAEPSRWSPEGERALGGDIGGSRTAHPVEGRVPFGARTTVQRPPLCLVDFLHACRPHGSRSRGSRTQGVRRTRLLAFRCVAVLGRSRGCRPSSSHRDVERVQAEPVATSARSPGRAFVPAGVPAEAGTRRRSYSVREVKGHERAAAMVQPIKVSPRTQDRVDRKRSRREYPTHTGARFAGRALCSPSQRDERRPRRR